MPGGLVGFRGVIRNTGIPVKNKLPGFYIVFKGDDSCPPPATASIVLNGKEIIFNCNSFKWVAMNATTTHAQNYTVISFSQFIFTFAIAQ